jgi:hypothetical protein
MRLRSSNFQNKMGSGIGSGSCSGSNVKNDAMSAAEGSSNDTVDEIAAGSMALGR